MRFFFVAVLMFNIMSTFRNVHQADHPWELPEFGILAANNPIDITFAAHIVQMFWPIWMVSKIDGMHSSQQNANETKTYADFKHNLKKFTVTYCDSNTSNLLGRLKEKFSQSRYLYSILPWIIFDLISTG